jgi:hypothetical protein
MMDPGFSARAGTAFFEIVYVLVAALVLRPPFYSSCDHQTRVKFRTDTNEQSHYLCRGTDPNLYGVVGTSMSSHAFDSSQSLSAVSFTN